MKTRHSNVWSALILALLLCLLVGVDTTLCPTAGTLGIPCPSCGMTRATLALLTGQVRRALAIHPGVFLVWPYLAAGLVEYLLLSRARNGSTPRGVRRYLSVVGLLLAGVLTVLWAARFFGYFGGPVPVKPWFVLRIEH